MASNPDVVVANGGRVIRVLMQLSHSIPIVLPGGSDPVALVMQKRWHTRGAADISGLVLLPCNPIPLAANP
jgi:ABC-type uncharacterized transport system substrate-binding protein